MRKFATLVSYLLHPILMPLLGVIIIFNSGIYETDIPWEYEKYTYMSFGLFSILLPSIVLPAFYYWKLISNIQLTERKERTTPFALTAFFLIALHIFIARIIPIKILSSYTFAIALLSIILLLVNIFTKVSMHLMSIGGITGLIIAITLQYEVFPFFWLSLIVLMAGLASTARLALKAHSVFQVWLGYLVGLATVSITILLML